MKTYLLVRNKCRNIKRNYIRNVLIKKIEVNKYMQYFNAKWYNSLTRHRIKKKKIIKSTDFDIINQKIY